MLMFGKELSVDQRLQKALVNILELDELTALSGVLMVGQRTLTDDPAMPTACTNGRDEIYNRTFISTLTNPELRFVILHESFHKMYRHLCTWQPLYRQDARLANMACDYVINLQLTDTEAHKRGDIAMPKTALLDQQFRGMNVAQVFKALQQQGQPSSEPEEGTGFDSHDWESTQEMTEQEQAELAKQIDDAIRQGQLAAKKLKRGDSRLFDDLLETKQDYRELMRDFVTTSTTRGDIGTWRRINRRYVGYDMLMPGTICEQIGDLVVATDASGSIGGPDLTAFLGELVGICEQVRPTRLHLLYWDTDVVRHETYDASDYDQIAVSTKPAGGGGTDVACVPAYLASKNITAECAVILTDGWLGGTWGEWRIPTLWVIKDNKGAVAPVGMTVHI